MKATPKINREFPMGTDFSGSPSVDPSKTAEVVALRRIRNENVGS
jgi:hypothetical protein